MDKIDVAPLAGRSKLGDRVVRQQKADESEDGLTWQERGLARSSTHTHTHTHTVQAACTRIVLSYPTQTLSYSTALQFLGIPLGSVLQQCTRVTTLQPNTSNNTSTTGSQQISGSTRLLYSCGFYSTT